MKSEDENNSPWELEPTHTNTTVINQTIEGEGAIFEHHCTGISLVILASGIASIPLLLFIYSVIETYYHYHRYINVWG